MIAQSSEDRSILYWLIIETPSIRMHDLLLHTNKTI